MRTRHGDLLVCARGQGYLAGVLSSDRTFRRYLKPDLLILDDFAMQEFTPAQGEDLYQLIDERVGRTSLIVTSNRSPQEWYPLFSNAVLAESALDRLAGAAHQLTLTGKSYRPRLRPPLGQPIALEVERP